MIAKTDGIGRDREEAAQAISNPIFSPKHVSIVCIGGGVSGIALAIEAQKTLKNFQLDIYEKNHDLGGTWLENNYPGCACESQSPPHGWLVILIPTV